MASAAPADAPAGAAQFGMVDIGRLLNDSKSRQQATADLQKLQQTFYAILRRLDQGSARFLSEADTNELAGLYEKEKPTEAEQKRISQLEEKGDTLKRELTTLQNTAKLDDTQSARLAALNDSQDKGNGLLQKLVTTLDGRLKDKERDANQKALVLVRAAVAKVAKAKNLSVVFTGDVAIYAQTDITEEVLKELNK